MTTDGVDVGVDDCAELAVPQALKMDTATNAMESTATRLCAVDDLNRLAKMIPFRSCQGEFPGSGFPSHQPRCCINVRKSLHIFATWWRGRLDAHRADRSESQSVAEIMRVLIVEDELFLAEAIQSGLRHEAIAADVALDGDEALRQIEVNEYDVVVLDRDIPGTHGDEVCRIVSRDFPAIRVLMLTAAVTLDDKIGGFERGADDYLTKPFAFKELVVRLRALHRRPAATSQPVLQFGDLRLDPFRREAYRDGRYLKLTRKQFAVLELLMRAGGGVVSAETLLEKVWDENTDPLTSAPRVTISTLRKALGRPDLIATIPGVGYRLSEVRQAREG